MNIKMGGNVWGFIFLHFVSAFTAVTVQIHLDRATAVNLSKLVLLKHLQL